MRKLLQARPRKRLSIAMAVYAAVAVTAALGVAVFVGDSGDRNGWQTDDEGNWLVAVLPASEYHPPGDSNFEGWAYLYAMCNRLDGAMRIGLGLNTEAASQMSAEGETEIGVWEVIYTVGETEIFAEVWAAVTSGEGAYLSPPEPEAMSDRLLADSFLVAWAAELGSPGSGHEATFDLDGYAEDVASEIGGCEGPLRT